MPCVPRYSSVPLLQCYALLGYRGSGVLSTYSGTTTIQEVLVYTHAPLYTVASCTLLVHTTPPAVVMQGGVHVYPGVSTSTCDHQQVTYAPK